MSSTVKAQLGVIKPDRRFPRTVAVRVRTIRRRRRWPNRPVRFIVTLGPGSGVDIGARLFADKLSARMGTARRRGKSTRRRRHAGDHQLP